MKLDDFEPRVPTLYDGQKLQFLWAKHLFGEAQRGAWVLWIKIGSSVTVAAATALSLWIALHGALPK